MKASFMLSGEYFCDLVRYMFWEENKEYKDAYSIICECLGLEDNNESVDVVNGILEYRYNLIGTNNLEMVEEEDRSKYTPITSKLIKLEREHYINNIISDMRENPREYVDPYSAYMSCSKTAFSVNMLNTYEHIFYYLVYGVTKFNKSGYDEPIESYNTPTKAGLWLFDHPEIVYEVGGVNGVYSSNFWDNLADYIDKNLNDESFVKRNERYKFNKKKFQYKEELDKQETAKEEKEPEFLPSVVEPDDIISPYGFVDKEGNWYSSGFGGHDVKSESIIEHLNLQEQYKESQCSDGSDFLINNLGFVKFQKPQIFLPWSIHCNNKPNAKQKDTLWKAIAKHDLDTKDINNIDLIF